MEIDFKIYSNFSLTVDDFKINHTGNVLDVISITMHEQYDDKTLENDIAILQIEAVPDLVPACLPPKYFKFDGHVGTPIGKTVRTAIVNLGK